jgi:hypothetical protein
LNKRQKDVIYKNTGEAAVTRSVQWLNGKAHLKDVGDPVLES